MSSDYPEPMLVRFPPGARERIAEAAKEETISRAAFMRRAVLRALDEQTEREEA
jgi:hypothetical protein